MISIRPFEAGDRDALYDMLAEVWPDQSAESLDRRWWWWNGALPPLHLAEDASGRLAGICGALPFTARVGGVTKRGAWILDFFVRSTHQGQGIGKKLVASFLTRFDFLASLNQTDAARATFLKSGWSDPPSVPLMLLASPAWYRAASALRRGGARVDVSITDTPTFGAEYDQLWSSTEGPSVAASIRDAATLQARFGGGASAGYLLVRATTASGRLEGYCIARELPPGSIRSFSRFPIMLVSDYLVRPGAEDAFAPLLDAVVAEARRRGLRFVLCMSSHAPHQRLLRRSGFLSGRTPVLGSRLRKLDVGFTATPNVPVEGWHLTPFDCDLDLLFGRNR